MKIVRTLIFMVLGIFFALDIANGQNRSSFINNSGSNMTFETDYNSLNIGNNSENSGLAMGGYSTVSSNGSSLNFNSKNNLTFYEPRNEEISIEYSIPQSVYDDLTKIRHNAYKAIIASFFKSSYNVKLLNQLSNYKYVDISAYAPIKLTLEIRANAPTPALKYGLELQFAAMNFLQKPAGNLLFEIPR